MDLQGTNHKKRAERGTTLERGRGAEDPEAPPGEGMFAAANEQGNLLLVVLPLALPLVPPELLAGCQSSSSLSR